MRDLFNRENCEKVVCLGDMTDKPILTAEEISAMSRFVDCSNDIMIVGNHCRSDKSGKLNTLRSTFNFVISEPTIIKTSDNIHILLLPYNSTVCNLSEIIREQGPVDIILSHNNIKGYTLGGHIITSGYDLQDITNNCKLFINGHLHNGGWVIKNKVINLGQLSGMNFSSCGGEWEPSVGILDTSTLEITIYENPVAYRFKKVQFSTLVELKNYLDNLPSKVNMYKFNNEVSEFAEYDDNRCEYVLQIKVPEKIAESSRKLISQYSQVISSRILTIHDKKTDNTTSQSIANFTESKMTIYNKLREFISTQDVKCNITKLNEIISTIEMKEGSQ